MTKRVLSAEERTDLQHWPGSNSSSEDRDYEVRPVLPAQPLSQKRVYVPEGANLVSMPSCFRPIKRHFTITRPGLLNLNLLKCTTEIVLNERRHFASSPFLKSRGQNGSIDSILKMLDGTVGSTFEGLTCFPSRVASDAVFTTDFCFRPSFE